VRSSLFVGIPAAAGAPSPQCRWVGRDWWRQDKSYSASNGACAEGGARAEGSPLCVIWRVAALYCGACDEGSGISTPATCSDGALRGEGLQCLKGICAEADAEANPARDVQNSGITLPITDRSSAQDTQAGSPADKMASSDAEGRAATEDAGRGPGPDPDGSEPCAGGSGCFGDPCSGGSDSYSGLCSQHLSDEVCTKAWDNESPTGWTCEQVRRGDGDTTDIYVSPVGHRCTSCFGEDDCSSDARLASCVDYGEVGSFRDGGVGYSARGGG
jgi:hypothetical protein